MKNEPPPQRPDAPEPESEPEGSRPVDALLLLVKIFLVIFLCEGAIMVALHLLRVDQTWRVVLDSIILALVCVLLLRRLITGPFHRAVTKLEETERGLRRRTGELESANAELERVHQENLAMTEALRKHHDEMVQREKMMTLGTMSAGVAHEIGNPLASISATVQWLTRHVDSDKVQERLRDIEGQIARITGIMRQMLEFARPSPGEWALVDVNELIEQTIAMTRYSHRSRHARVESIPNRDLPTIRLMPQQFQQVLVNLLLNAFDAVEGLPDERAVVSVKRILKNGQVRIIVTDRGLGMNEEQVSQAFEPFYTTKPPGKGTGLGLAVSYKLINRQGGRIHIESVPGEGTAVTMVLPVSEPAADATAQAAEPNFWASKAPCWAIRECGERIQSFCSAYSDQSVPCWEHEDTWCKKMFGASVCLKCEVFQRYEGTP